MGTRHYLYSFAGSASQWVKSNAIYSTKFDSRFSVITPATYQQILQILFHFRFSYRVLTDSGKIANKIGAIIKSQFLSLLGKRCLARRSAVKCSSCKFFETTQMDEDVGQGWCKRYAPQGTWPMIDKKR